MWFYAILKILISNPRYIEYSMKIHLQVTQSFHLVIDAEKVIVSFNRMTFLSRIFIINAFSNYEFSVWYFEINN